MPFLHEISVEQLVDLDACLDKTERMTRNAVRDFVRREYLPHAGEYFDQEKFPKSVIARVAALGLLGANLQGYGCAGIHHVAYGLALQELEYGDSGLRSFVSVQGSLCMYPIHAFGSERQKKKYLPEMAAGKLVACFGLTEADGGSDPQSMQTKAVATSGGYVINGAKMWITNAPIADLAVIFARLEGAQGDTIRGFLIERGTGGFYTPTMQGKYSLRASCTGEIVMDDCFVPDANLLPGTKGLGSALDCLNQARIGIAWGAIGAARACFDAALSYAKERVLFGKPIASRQIIQQYLVDMATEIAKAQIMVYHLTRLKETGRLSPYQVSMAKRNNVAMALEVARRARSILGANGIMMEYPVIRHMLNLESVYTYEGTHEVHTLILGRGLTGFDAFS